MINDKLLIVNV